MGNRTNAGNAEEVAGMDTAMAVSLALAALIIAALLLIIRANARERILLSRAASDDVTNLCKSSTGEQLIELMLARRGDRRLALALIDVDDITQLREACGEAACDAMLRDVAQRLSADIEGRGGLYHVMNDTFLVALWFEGADNVARDQIDAMRAKFSGTMLDFGRAIRARHASAGVAICPTNGKHYPELYEKADMALFWAKRDGKDRTRLYEELTTAR